MVKEKTPLSLFESALKKNKIAEYLRGEAGYSKFPGPDEYGEPTSFWYVLEHGIYKYYEQNKDDVLINKLKNSLIEIMHDNKGIFCVIEYLNVYLNHLEKGKAPFLLPLEDLVDSLKMKLEVKRADLISDKRWSGSQWNSDKGKLEAQPLGIWKTILCYGKYFNDKYQINILPEEAWGEIKENPELFTFKGNENLGSNI